MSAFHLAFKACVVSFYSQSRFCSYIFTFSARYSMGLSFEHANQTFCFHIMTPEPWLLDYLLLGNI